MESVPVKLWGLDPLHRCHVKLFVKDVLQLNEYPGFKGVYALNNHPIFKAQIFGYVVKVERKEKNTVYGVDDGTGCIPCCHWLNDDEYTEISEQAIHLGDLVTVFGRITIFREQQQILITIISVEKNPNAEVMFWLEAIKNKEIYNTPFVTPAQLDPKSKIIHKPWLNNPLAIEIDGLEQSLKSEIKEFLQSNNVQSFKTDDLYGVSVLKEKATAVFEKYMEQHERKKEELKDPQELTKEPQELTKEPQELTKEAQELTKEPQELTKEPQELTKDNFHDVIYPQLKRLNKEGVVYRKGGLGRYFEVISKENLHPEILQVMKKTKDKEGESSSGITSSDIMKSLKMLERYEYLRKKRVEYVLKSLVECGDLYEVDDYHYKLLGV